MYGWPVDEMSEVDWLTGFVFFCLADYADCPVALSRILKREVTLQYRSRVKFYDDWKSVPGKRFKY